MFSSRRLAKRSIIGTRVAALWSDDQRYYAGKIVTIISGSGRTGQDRYEIRFDDGFSGTYLEKEIIGAGFQGMGIASLKAGQPVYVTHLGREVIATVVRHDRVLDEIEVEVDSPAGAVSIERKLEECRLFESRRSSRLQDADKDYCKLANVRDSQRRTQSLNIDVPFKHSRRRKNARSPDPEDMFVDPVNEYDDDEFITDDDSQVMDEVAAARVLTSFSTSPLSPTFPSNFYDQTVTSPASLELGSSETSSGIASNSDSSVGGGAASLVAVATPSSSTTGKRASRLRRTSETAFVDEGIVDDSDSDEYEMGSKKQKVCRTVFRCTWPGCKRVHNTTLEIEQHVRSDHLGPREEGTSDDSDHEEEFYYEEVEVTVDTVTQGIADLHTRSSPTICEDSDEVYTPRRKSNSMSTEPICSPIPDHDYGKKHTAPWKIPSNKRAASFGSFSTSSHDVTPTSWKVHSYSGPNPSPPAARISKSHEKLSFHHHSPRGHISASPNGVLHKKSRAARNQSDMKKCRKVYGMENREMWCTQCKWKKACTRFLEGH